MASHKQAEKRNRQRLRLQAHNRHHKSTMRTRIKHVRLAIEGSDAQEAQQALKTAVPLIDRCAQKKIIPRKRASRIVSRLTCAVNKLATAQ